MTGTKVDLEGLIARSPFLSWLGITVSDVSEDEIKAQATWREEWVANPVLGQTQGGVIAAVLDFAASFALYSRFGKPFPTIDLRIDYHRFAKNGDLFVTGRVVRCGRQIATCDSHILDAGGRLLASARGTFILTGGE